MTHTANGFDEVGWNQPKRSKPPTNTASVSAVAALDAQRRSLAELETTPLYQQLCGEADARRLVENAAPKYASGRLK